MWIPSGVSIHWKDQGMHVSTRALLRNGILSLVLIAACTMEAGCASPRYVNAKGLFEYTTTAKENGVEGVVLRETERFPAYSVITIDAGGNRVLPSGASRAFRFAVQQVGQLRKAKYVCVLKPVDPQRSLQHGYLFLGFTDDPKVDPATYLGNQFDLTSVKWVSFAEFISSPPGGVWSL
jgi:hypothetical protein